MSNEKPTLFFIMPKVNCSALTLFVGSLLMVSCHSTEGKLTMIGIWWMWSWVSPLKSSISDVKLVQISKMKVQLMKFTHWKRISSETPVMWLISHMDWLQTLFLCCCMAAMSFLSKEQRQGMVSIHYLGLLLFGENLHMKCKCCGLIMCKTSQVCSFNG